MERFAAFAVLGLLLGMAHPGRRALFRRYYYNSGCSTRMFIPDRDAEYPDMIIKAAGGLAGIGFAAILSRLFPWKD